MRICSKATLNYLTENKDVFGSVVELPDNKMFVTAPLNYLTVKEDVFECYLELPDNEDVFDSNLDLEP